MSQQQPGRVDSKFWQSCAGNSVKIPKLHSRVYYFPLGHLEHANPSPNTQSLSFINCYRPVIPCIISAVDLLADPHSDEVFAKLLLTPVTDGTIEPPDVPHEDQENNVGVVSSSKTLTQSDASNGGAFSVRRQCADKILPPLDINAEQAPFQQLFFTDVHGEEWGFRHIYCGAPKRHLITNGWSKFVDKKKLVAGDSLVLLKNSAGRIFVGIRRKSDASRSGKITEKAVMEAVELAEKNKAFEVVYYPTVGNGDHNFVVDAKVVEDAMKINWNCGMRVKLPLKNDDSKSKRKSFGTISNLCAPSNRPWRMLQVKWDELIVSENTTQVNPWTVEPIFNKPELHLTKKRRVDPGSTLSRSTARDSTVPMAKIHHSSMGSFNQTLSNCNPRPDGMQGARQYPFSASTSSKVLNDKENDFFQNKTDDLSPHSHSIVNSFATKLSGAHNCNTKKVRPNSIKLFGKIIQTVGSNLPDSDIKGGNDGCKSCNETEDINKTCTKIAQ